MLEMELDFYGVTVTIIQLFFVLVVGFAAYKFKLMDDAFLKKLSNFIVCVANPFMILGGLLNVEKYAENLKNGFTIVGVAFLIILFSALAGNLISKPFKSPEERKIGEFSTAFTNCGFMGIMVLKAAFGEIGAFYCAFFLIAFNLSLWTYGVSVFARKRPDIKPKPLNAVLNYGTVPCILGIILYILPFELPTAVTGSFSLIGNICTPCSMFIIGGLLATVSIKKTLLNWKLYYLALFKTLIIPIVAVMICTWLSLPTFYIYFVAIMAAMPAATNTAMFAERYDVAPVFGAQVAGISTVISVFATPAVIHITNLIVNFYK